MTQSSSAADAPVNEALPLRGVKEIIEAAGGPGAIANASDGTLTIEAVYKWPKIGIRDQHWSIIMGLCDVTPDELYAANRAARAPSQSGD